MQKIKYYLEKYKIIIIILLIVITMLGIICYKVLHPQKEKVVLNTIEKKEKSVKKEENIEKIKVDIKGFINKPGVYEMSNADRVIDVINKAGGLKENSNTEYINLSKKITDEMIIIIYSNDEVRKFKEVEKEVIYIEYECVCPDNKNDACINSDDVVNTNGVKDSLENETDKEDNLISINTGTLEELITLTGIGESKAQAIIEYREKNGEFKKIEDIMNVSGIGESAYSKIKDNIKL